MEAQKNNLQLIDQMSAYIGYCFLNAAAYCMLAVPMVGSLRQMAEQID